MRILFLGDVVGRSGREAILNKLPGIRADLLVDIIVVNCENATSGRGLKPEHARNMLEAGIDCITLGDHAFDQKEMLAFIDKEPRIIRPLNYSKAAPGQGTYIASDTRGRKILIAQVLGQIFMNRPYDDPFSSLDKVFQKFPLSGQINASFVDCHCEATSEKMAIGHFCDGRASAVVGTHTHIPTADSMILSKGTGYQTDAGMCGDYNSVIGMQIKEPMRRFITGMASSRFSPAVGEATLCGVFFETNDSNGLTKQIRPVKFGKILQQDC